MLRLDPRVALHRARPLVSVTLGASCCKRLQKAPCGSSVTSLFPMRQSRDEQSTKAFMLALSIPFPFQLLIYVCSRSGPARIGRTDIPLRLKLEMDLGRIGSRAPASGCPTGPSRASPPYKSAVSQPSP